MFPTNTNKEKDQWNHFSLELWKLFFHIWCCLHYAFFYISPLFPPQQGKAIRCGLHKSTYYLLQGLNLLEHSFVVSFLKGTVKFINLYWLALKCAFIFYSLWMLWAHPGKLKTCSSPKKHRLVICKLSYQKHPIQPKLPKESLPLNTISTINPHRQNSPIKLRQQCLHHRAVVCNTQQWSVNAVLIWSLILNPLQSTSPKECHHCSKRMVAPPKLTLWFAVIHLDAQAS